MPTGVTRVLMVWTALVTCAAASASEIDQLVRDLSSNDTSLRVHARQVLPRQGVDALDELIPLLSREDYPLRAAAFNVVADILNVAAANGGANAKSATDQIMTLLAAEQPEFVKLQALRLLPIVTPEGCPVDPVAALLKNEGLREKARAALVEINTVQASDALVSGLYDADASFAVAILDGLTQMEKLAGYDPSIVMQFANHPDASVRVATIRAIAYSGRPEYLPVARGVVADATAETKYEAEDALLRLADAMATRGGNWDRAMATYQGLLVTSELEPIRAAALMGLGRYGDVTMIQPIVAASRGSNTMEEAAVLALSAMRGKESVSAVVATFPHLSGPIRLGLLEFWGQHSEPLAAVAARAALESGDGALKMAALRALAAGGSMDAIPALVEVIRSGSEAERTIAQTAVVRLADSVEASGNKENAGKAYVQLFGLSDDVAVRKAALRGIARNPMPDAYGTAQAALADDGLKPEAIDALMAVAGSLAKAGDTAKVQEAVGLIRQADASPEMLVRLATQLQGAGAPPELANLLGVVRKWKVVGPFDWKDDAAWDTAFVGEPGVAPDSTVKFGDQVLEWKSVETPDAMGLVDLTGNIASRDRCFGYAYAEVEFTDETDGQIRLGSDDGNQVWLNGKKVWENRVDRGAALDQDTIDVHFTKGLNTVLVKVSQGAGGWNFLLRLCEPSGVGLSFTQP